MTKRQRTILFSICAFLFLLAAFSTIFYSQGYRFDFEKKKVRQTGAFYFKVLPKSSQVYLDSQLKKKTDFLFGAVFIENLLPRKYKVQIKKEGYHSWEKTLEIREKEVAEAKNIILIPESPNFFILTKGVKNFFFSPDEKKIILLETNGISWELKLYDLKSGIKSHLIESIDIAKEEVELLSLFFSFDSKKILLKVGLKENLKYFLLDLENTPALLTSLDFLGKEIEDISFHPKDSQKLLFLAEGKLGQVNLTDKEASFTPLEDIFAWTAFDGSIYYLEKNGFLYKSDFSFAPKEKINEAAFPLKKEVKYEISAFAGFFFLKENEDLYLFNPEVKMFEKIFEKTKELKISPDFEKLAYFSDSEIWVLFLKKQEGQPQKKAGEKLFLTRFSEKIGDVSWFSSHYLIFNSENKIKIAEIDDRDRINIIDLAEFETPEILFNRNDGKLYILSGGNLFVSELLF